MKYYTTYNILSKQLNKNIPKLSFSDHLPEKIQEKSGKNNIYPVKIRKIQNDL